MKLKRLFLLFIIVLLIGISFLIYYRFHPAIYGKLEWLYGKELVVTKSTNLEGTSVQASELCNRDLVYFSNAGLNLAPKKILEIHLLSPCMQRENDYLLVYDREGTEAVVFYKNKELYTVKTEHRISKAKVNDEGYTVIISEQPGYRAAVTVYNRKGKNIYKIYSGEKFVLDADVYQNGNWLATCQYDIKEEKPFSAISFYRLDEKETQSVATSTETFFSEIEFTKDGNVFAIGDSATYGFSTDGKELWKYEYGGGALQSFSISEHLVALVLRQQTQKVSLINKKGSVNEFLYDGADIKNITCNKDGALFSTTRDLVYLNRQGYRLADIQVTRDVSELYLEEKGKNGIVLYESGYDAVKVK